MSTDLQLDTIVADTKLDALFDQFVEFKTGSAQNHVYSFWKALNKHPTVDQQELQSHGESIIHQFFHQEAVILPEELTTSVESSDTFNADSFLACQEYLATLLNDVMLPEFNSMMIQYPPEKKKEVVSRFVSQECEFVSQLEVTNHVVVEGLKPILDRNDINNIFSNVAQLLMIHDELTDALTCPEDHEELIITPDGDLPIGQIFMSKLEYFKMYVEYNLHLGNALEVLAQLNKDNNDFNKKLAEFAQNPRCLGLTVFDLVTGPAQHIENVPQRFDQLLQATAPFQRDFVSLKSCQEHFQKLVIDIDSKVTQQRSAQKALNLQNMIEWDGDEVDLLAPGREFIAQESFQFLSSAALKKKKPKVEQRDLILFSDLLVVCKPKSGVFKKKAIKFTSKTQVSVISIAVSDTSDTEVVKNGFQILAMGAKEMKVLTFMANSIDLKQKWMDLLQASVEKAQQAEESGGLGSSSRRHSKQKEQQTERELFAHAKSKYGDIVNDLRSALTIKDRKGRLLMYRQTFVGKQAVNWLSSSQYSDSRINAESLIQEMIEDGIVILARGKTIDKEDSFLRFVDDDHRVTTGVELKVQIPGKKPKSRYQHEQETNETKMVLLPNLRRTQPQTRLERNEQLLMEEQELVEIEYERLLNTLGGDSEEVEKVKQLMKVLEGLRG